MEKTGSTELKQSAVGATITGGFALVCEIARHDPAGMVVGVTGVAALTGLLCAPYIEPVTSACVSAVRSGIEPYLKIIRP